MFLSETWLSQFGKKVVENLFGNYNVVMTSKDSDKVRLDHLAMKKYRHGTMIINRTDVSKYCKEFISPTHRFTALRYKRGDSIDRDS